MKKCTKCGEVKSLDKFGNRKSMKDGKRNDCKTCQAERNKQYYQANKEKVVERVTQYYQKNKEKIVTYKKKHRQANKEKIAERDKQYNKANKEKIAEHKRQYNRVNKEKIAEYWKKYRKTNKEKVTEFRKQYRQKNKERFRLYNSRRRTKKKILPNTLTHEQWNQILEHFNGCCALTGSTEDIHIEHFIPIAWASEGGTTHKNCYPMSGALNSSKQDSNPYEWIKRFPEYGEAFNQLVKYLAEQNDMSEKEFEDYVYWCESNKVDIEASKQLQLQHIGGDAK